MQEALNRYPNLDIRAGSVFDLVLGPPPMSHDVPRSEVKGVKLGSFPISLAVVRAHTDMLPCRLGRGHNVLASRHLHRDVPFGRDTHRFARLPVRIYND